MHDEPESLNSEELARQVQAGSSAAFAELVDRYGGRLQRYLRQRVGQDHDAEDLAQETLLRAFSAIGRYQPARSFATWLFTIATRLACSHLRSRARRKSAEVEPGELIDVRSPTPADASADRERDGQVWLLARELLTENQFAALWLHYVEQLPVKDVAAAMGKTRIHVKVMMHRGRQRLLKSRLTSFSEEGDGIGDRPAESANLPIRQSATAAPSPTLHVARGAGR